MKPRKKVQYANPILHVVRKRTTMLATQLEGEGSLETLLGLYLTVVAPSAFGDEDVFQLLNYDKEMGVLWFTPTELPLEMTVGDWLVYDGDNLSVVHDSTFKAQYRVALLHNKKEKHVREKSKLERVREGALEGYSWFIS